MNKLSDKYSTHKGSIIAEIKDVSYIAENGEIRMLRDGKEIWKVEPMFRVGHDGSTDDFFSDSKYAGAFDEAENEYCVRWPMMEKHGIKGDIFFDPKTF